MVSRLPKEFEAEGFYGQNWFKLFGSFNSDLMIKLITLEVQEPLLDIPGIATQASRLWGRPCMCVVRVGVRGLVRCSVASQQWKPTWLVWTHVRVKQGNSVALGRGLKPDTALRVTGKRVLLRILGPFPLFPKDGFLM